jgi:alpha-amylase
LELAKGKKKLALQNVLSEGTVLRDAYSGTTATVTNGEVVIDSPYDIVLLENK